MSGEDYKASGGGNGLVGGGGDEMCDRGMRGDVGGGG